MLSGTFKKFVNERIRSKLPRIFNLSPAIVQVYRGGDWETSFSIVNFPSFFAPTSSGVYNYRVSVRDENGTVCGTKNFSIKEKGSAEFDPSRWSSKQIGIGTIKVEIQPSGLFFARDRHLGVIRPQIYAHYQHAKSRSVGIVHPQTAELTKSAPRPAWASNQLISMENVTTIEVAQINPNPLQYDATLKLIDFETQQILLERVVQIPPRGALLSSLEMSKVSYKGKTAFLTIDRLPGANAKPLLFIERNGASYFVMHS